MNRWWMPPVQPDAVRAYKDRGLSDTPDRFDRALTVLAKRHADLRAAALRHRDEGRKVTGAAYDDAADEVVTDLVLVLADSLERSGLALDQAEARAVESVDFLLEAAHDKLAKACAL